MIFWRQREQRAEWLRNKNEFQGESLSQVGTWHSRRESLFGCLVVLTGAMSNLSAHAAAGAPLPRCGAGTESFYLARYLKVDRQDFENRMLKNYIRNWPASEDEGQ